MMGIVVSETCWAYKKHNKVISGIHLVLTLQLSQWCTVQYTSDSFASVIKWDRPNSEREEKLCQEFVFQEQ